MDDRRNIPRLFKSGDVVLNQMTFCKISAPFIKRKTGFATRSGGLKYSRFLMCRAYQCSTHHFFLYAVGVIPYVRLKQVEKYVWLLNPHSK